MAWVLPGVRPTIAIFAVMYLVCGSQVSVTVPDGSLPSGTMICAGPLAAALVVPLAVALAVADEGALDELADGVEDELHAPAIAATTMPLTAIRSALDRVVPVCLMMFRLLLTHSP